MEDNFPTLKVDDIIDWEVLAEIFDASEEDDDDIENIFSYIIGVATVGKIVTLLRIEDEWGWDDLVLLPNGKMVLPDRNSGGYNMTSERVPDPNLFAKQVVAALTGVPMPKEPSSTTHMIEVKQTYLIDVEVDAGEELTEGVIEDAIADYIEEGGVDPNSYSYTVVGEGSWDD